MNFDLRKHHDLLRNRNKNKALWAVIFSLILVGSLIFLHFHNQHEEKVEAEFAATNPWRETLDIKKEYVAQIRSVQHIELRSLEKGYLQNIYVDEGQFVRKGQKMFQIMPLLLQAELKKAHAEYQLTKIEYDNTLLLYKKNVVSANELALTKARLDKAQAEMEAAQAHLNFSTVKAPFDGIMDRFHVRLGSLVDEGELLTTLSDNSKMWLYFNVSEADYLDYMEHSHKSDNQLPIELRLANGSIFSHTGKIDTIEADFNNEVGNVAFRATFPNTENLLRHGETGTVLLTKKFENALVIPQKATFEVLDKKFVFLIDENNRLVSKQIKIAAEVEHLFIIASGVSENDKILIDGLGKVHNGDVVKTTMQDRETVKQSLNLTTK